jgi:adenine-specific DNA-methyltransferase
MKTRAKTLRVPASCLVYTPPLIADAMVKALDPHPNDRWLEPCVGKGALLEALAKSGVKPRQIIGVDLSRTKERADKLANVERGVEFLKWSQLTNERFDKIIANPPYIALERLQKSVRAAACEIETFDYLKVSAAANCWYAFLCAGLNLLRQGGSMCFLLPAAWDFANYAEPLRRDIVKYFESVEVYRSKKPLFQFAKIQEGIILLIARRFRFKKCGQSAMTGCFVRSEVLSAEILAKQLGDSSDRKMASMSSIKEGFPVPSVISQRETKAVGEMLLLGIGGVTGDARFFLMNEERRKLLGLPVNSLRPSVTRARHLVSAVLTAGSWNELRGANERIWIFDPKPVSLRNKAVQDYMRWGQREGCDIGNYKIAIRKPWYRTRLPMKVDGFISGMSQHGPWICFREMPRLTATNTLYVVEFLDCIEASLRFAVALSMLTSMAQEGFSKRLRRYADGLMKYELGDLREVRLPIAGSTRGSVPAYKTAIFALLSGNAEKAQKIADNWFFQSGLQD